MTSRGGGNRIPIRPVTPPAPDSLTVPSRKLFTSVRSIGPGATEDIKSRVRSLNELKRSGAVVNRFDPTSEYAEFIHDIESTARIEGDAGEEPTDDPTWGFRVIITSFSPNARENLHRALANWIKAQQMELPYQIVNATFLEEINQRFKLDIIEDESLENASDDRIREEFRAWMTALDFFHLAGFDGEVESLGRGCNPSQMFCLVLDEEKISMLAGLTFDDFEKDRKTLENLTVRVIDGNWKRPSKLRLDETYRGIGDVSVVYLYEFFKVMAAWDGHMIDTHPLNGIPEYIAPS